MPSSIRGVLAGTAQLFQQSLGKEPILILTAIAAVYILLGVLYESYIHPITILSTLPSAGVGAILALIVFHVEFDIIGLIGVILLIGIVKKNAIMMIDFAIEAKRRAIELLRRHLRSLFAALSPDHDDDFGRDPRRHAAGAEFRQRRRNSPPLGISIVGGLIDQPVADALHDARALSLHGPPEWLVTPHPAAAAGATAGSVRRAPRRVRPAATTAPNSSNVDGTAAVAARTGPTPSRRMKRRA
jgi:hypothetical protein